MGIFQILWRATVASEGDPTMQKGGLSRGRDSIRQPLRIISIVYPPFYIQRMTIIDLYDERYHYQGERIPVKSC
jgi:hypothetical protein